MASDSSKPKIVVKVIEDGWTSGYVHYNGWDYGFAMKNFIEPSEFGINKGCISKLMIVNEKGSGDLVVNYDRGWDIKPQTEPVKAGYRALVSKFNRSMPEEYVQDWYSGKRVTYPKRKKTSEKKTAKTNALRDVWNMEF